MSSLYKQPKSLQSGKVNVVKTDCSVMQHLLIAYESGRSIDLDNMLQFELTNVPVSLVETKADGVHALRSGQKSLLIEELTHGIPCPPAITVDAANSAIVIDGQAFLVAMGKPKGTNTFGELADIFVNRVCQTGANFSRIDVVFDRYDGKSIKSGERNRRKTGLAIRRSIESGDIPLPGDWSGFLSLGENKADLAHFLAESLLENTPQHKVLVISGASPVDTEILCSDPSLDISGMQANHEEADTRIVLHCVSITFDTVVVVAWDTDVLLLLMAHCANMPCRDLWLKAGTYMKQKYIRIRELVAHNNLDASSAKLLLPFHALTGCDSTSYFARHTKKTCIKTFFQHKEYLKNLGNGELSDDTIQDVETFVCRVYATPDDTTDKAKVRLFKRVPVLMCYHQLHMR